MVLRFGCKEIAMWGSCGVGESRCGELLCGEVAIWKNYSVREMQCERVTALGSCSAVYGTCGGVAVM